MVKLERVQEGVSVQQTEKKRKMDGHEILTGEACNRLTNDEYMTLFCWLMKNESRYFKNGHCDDCPCDVLKEVGRSIL